MSVISSDGSQAIEDADALIADAGYGYMVIRHVLTKDGDWLRSCMLKLADKNPVNARAAFTSDAILQAIEKAKKQQ